MRRNSSPSRRFLLRYSNMKIYCTFPDETHIEVDVLEITNTQTKICYYYEDINQTLWVPNDFIKAN